MTHDKSPRNTERTEAFQGLNPLRISGFDSTLTHQILEGCSKSTPDSVLQGVRYKNASVKVGRFMVGYRQVCKGGKVRWVVSDYRSGARVLRSAVDEEAAKALALEIGRDLAAGRSSTSEVSANDALALAECRKLGVTVTELLNSWKRLGMGALTPTRVAGAVAKYLEIQKSAVSAIHLRHIACVLNRLAGTVKSNVQDVTTDDCYKLAHQGGASPKTIQNRTKILTAFFAFCISRKMMADSNPTEGVSQPAIVQREIEIMTPAALQALLDACPSNLVPLAALQAFAGLRVSEVARLTVEQLHSALNSGWLRLTASQTKTKRARVIPVLPALRVWLQDNLSAEGNLVADSIKENIAGAIKEATGLSYGHNALRHSFCTYYFCQTKNLGEVAKVAGHTMAVSQAHYSRSDILPETAEAWFGARPKQASNVVNLK